MHACIYVIQFSDQIKEFIGEESGETAFKFSLIVVGPMDSKNKIIAGLKLHI